jgi:HEAT repeat protein
VSHPLIERMHEPDPEARRAACAAAAEDPNGILLIDALAEALGDPVRAVSRAATDALVALGRRDRAVDAVLRRALRSDDVARRFAAATASARLAPPGPTLIPALVSALGHRDGDIRWSAARLLVDTGRLHGEVLGILTGLVRAADRPRVRRMAAFSLSALAPDLPETARALVDATRDEDLSVCRAALTSLAPLLDPPPFVLERLLEVLEADPDEASRRIATVALAELGASDPAALPPGVTDRLRALASSAEDDGLRRGALRALARLGLATADGTMPAARPTPRPPLDRVPR